MRDFKSAMRSAGDDMRRLSRLSGAVAELELNSRVAALGDFDDLYATGDRALSFMRNLSNTFSKVSGIAYWNTFWKQVAYNVTQARIIQNVQLGVDKLGKAERAWMANLGIGPEQAAEIAEAYSKQVGRKIVAGELPYANHELWPTKAGDAFRSALANEANNVIITPQLGDRPIFAATPVGRLLFQFRSYTMASQARLIGRHAQLASLDETGARKAAFGAGLFGLVMMSAVVDGLKRGMSSNDADFGAFLQRWQDHPGESLYRALDRSAILGVIADGSSILDRAGGPSLAGGLQYAFGDLKPEHPPRDMTVFGSLDRATSDKRKRFKNEIDFLARTTHPNLVKVSDYGLSQVKSAEGPFYVMRRYKCSLRGLMQTGISHEEVMPLFISILNGLEAAHLKRAVHRDLKPENMLCDESGSSLAIADFGVARFSADDLLTAVETRDAQRLANFLYAAPEQREKGKDVGAAADIYALGLILNELFTGSVPHGTDYKQISSVAPDFAFLDPIVARMLRQSASDRPTSIAELKKLISVYQSEAIAQQKLSSMDGAVIPQGQIDDPLALVPPKLVGVDWVEGTLILKLDRQVHQQWVWALNNMRNFSSIMGADATHAELFRERFDGELVVPQTEQRRVRR